MSHFIQKLKNHFSFRKGESVGLSLMIILIVIILAIPYVYKFFKKEGRTDFTLFDSQVREFQNQQLAAGSKQTLDFSHNSNSKYQFSKYQKYSKYQIPLKSINKQFNKSENFIIELNAADSLELMRLKGIGPVFAKRIMRYRELLGGYWRKEQLLEVWGMDTVRYNGIKKHICINRDSIHKININRITFKKLMKHPYFGYEVARGIMEYRMNHGEFNTLEDVRKVKNINDSTYKKLEPYVKVR